QNQLPSILKPINKQFNALNTLESHRFVTLQQELSKVIKTKLGVSIRNKVRKGMQTVSDKLALVQSTIATNSQHVQDLKTAEVFKKANAEGEKWEKTTLKHQLRKTMLITLIKLRGEQHSGDATMANAQGEQPPV
ncbi:hypothetical protein Tco_0530784, partial [Tanacetum coccineum]